MLGDLVGGDGHLLGARHGEGKRPAEVLVGRIARLGQRGVVARHRGLGQHGVGERHLRREVHRAPRHLVDDDVGQEGVALLLGHDDIAALVGVIGHGGVLGSGAAGVGLLHGGGQRVGQLRVLQSGDQVIGVVVALKHLVGPRPGIHLGQKAIGDRLAVERHAHVRGVQREGKTRALHLEGVVAQHLVEHLMDLFGRLAGDVHADDGGLREEAPGEHDDAGEVDKGDGA